MRSESAGEWRQMGQGQYFLVRECFPLFLSYTKPIDFFPVLSEELSNISFQCPPHGHDTWTRVRSVQSPAEGRGAHRELDSTHQIPLCILNLFSTKCVCTIISSAISERAALCIIKLRSSPHICSLMALTSASSSVTPNVRVENQTLPSHEPSGQTDRLFLRKRRSGSQKRKLAFRSKYNTPLETGVSAKNWTVNLCPIVPHSLFCCYFCDHAFKPKHQYSSSVSLRIGADGAKDFDFQDGVCFELWS